MARPTDAERFKALTAALYSSDRIDGYVGSESGGRVEADLSPNPDVPKPFGAAKSYAVRIGTGLGYSVEFTAIDEWEVTVEFTDTLRDDRGGGR